jgi:Icc protein
MNRQFRSVDKNRSQGLFVQVYRDKVTVRGRDFAAGAWLPEADWTIPLK